MSKTTVTLSSKGQLSLPKEIRDTDHLTASDVFQLERLAPGKYLLEKLVVTSLPKAKLVRSKEGFLIFRPAKGARSITADLIRKLESETI